MRVLITGGAGFIGSNIVDACLSEGHRVVIVDDLSSGRMENIPNFPASHFRRMTISDAHGLLSAAKDFVPDVICHQAAQPSLRRSIEMPDYDAQINIIGTINVIAAARSAEARLVFASTSAVYDQSGNVPFIESDCMRPNLPYGIAKAAGENYIRHSGLSYAILRYGNVYGPRQVPVGENQLIPHVLNHLIKGNKFVINGDGDQTRDFVYVGDIVRANMLAMKSDQVGTFNIGSGRMESVNCVCDLVAEIALGGKHIFIHGPSKEGEVRHSGLNPKLAKAMLGWQAETSLRDGLKATIDWYRESA